MLLMGICGIASVILAVGSLRLAVGVTHDLEREQAQRDRAR